MIPGLRKKPTAKRAFRTEYRIMPDKIVTTILNHYDIPFADLKTKDRFPKLVHIRRMMYYFLFKYSSMNKKEIGQMFNRDHTTIIFGLEQIKDLRWAYPEIESEILIIDSKL